jgi:hypothetical protein
VKRISGNARKTRLAQSKIESVFSQARNQGKLFRVALYARGTLVAIMKRAKTPGSFRPITNIVSGCSQHQLFARVASARMPRGYRNHRKLMMIN